MGFTNQNLQDFLHEELTRRKIHSGKQFLEVSGLIEYCGFSVFLEWLKSSDPNSIFHEISKDLYSTEELFMENQNIIWGTIESIKMSALQEVGT